MEKIELQKKLEKKRAYHICLMIFLGLLTPTFLSICSHYGVSFNMQVLVFFGMLSFIGYTFKNMQKIEKKIENIPSIL